MCHVKTEEQVEEAIQLNPTVVHKIKRRQLYNGHSDVEYKVYRHLYIIPIYYTYILFTTLFKLYFIKPVSSF